MLTAELSHRCREVLAVEVDPALCTALRRRFAREPQVSVICGDFLRFRLPTEEPYKVFGNIPFSLSSAIVRRLADARNGPEDAHLVMQREAGLRFAGGPFGPETLVSLLLKPRWQVEIVRDLRRGDFDPPPRVRSVMVWLARRRRPLVEESELRAYQSFVTASFGRRGRTVGRCLRASLTRHQVTRLARALNFDPSLPPSALSFDQWLGLFRFHIRKTNARDQGV
jgi:23S rRNA (adenine-N6)-dimethyltransferase